MTVRITGLKELDNALSHFEPALSRKILRKAVRKAARPVLETAKARVPVKTGALKRSLKIRALKRSRRFKHRIGVQVVTGEAFFKGETFYGGIVEYGQKARGIPGKPFMRPARDENRERVRVVFETEVKPLIDETAREVKK